MQKLIQSKWFEWICLSGILLLFGFLYLHVNTQGTYILQDYRQGSYYSQLGTTFEKGQLGINDMIGGDWAESNGKYYLYHGPFPALVWLFIKTYLLEVSMSFLSIFLLVVNLTLFYFIARKISFFAEFEEKKAIIARFIFLFVYGLGIPYFLAGRLFVYESSIIFGSTFLLGAVFLFMYYLTDKVDLKKSFPNESLFLIGSGILVAFAFLSRINLLLAFIPFTLIFIWKEWQRNKTNLHTFADNWLLFCCFMIPIALSLIGFGYYNVARFGNPFDFGVSHLTTSSDEDNYRLKSGRSVSLQYGLLNVMQATILIPSFDTKPSYINYTSPSWLVGPYPRLTNVEFGGSIFFSSPLLLFLFALPFYWKKFNKKMREVSLLLLGVSLSVGTYSYFFMGFTRRYHQDYYPFLMLFSLIGFYYFWQVIIIKMPKTVQRMFWILITLVVIMTGLLAVHLNCLRAYYGQFERCLDIRQPIQWFQPLS